MRRLGCALALGGIVLLVAACGPGAPAATPVDYTREDALCTFQPIPGARPYAGDTHPLVIPYVGGDLAEPSDLLAGQPIEAAQLAGCSRTVWLATGVTCSYGDPGGTLVGDWDLGRQQLTLWVLALDSGRLLDSTTLTGPEPTKGDCPSSVTEGQLGLLPGPVLSADAWRSYLEPFVHGAPRQPVPTPATLTVALVTLPTQVARSGEVLVEVRTMPGARCTLALIQPMPAATPMEVDIYPDGAAYAPLAGPDGIAAWDWFMDTQTSFGMPVSWQVGPASMTATCTLNGASAEASGQVAIVGR